MFVNTGHCNDSRWTESILKKWWTEKKCTLIFVLGGVINTLLTNMFDMGSLVYVMRSTRKIESNKPVKLGLAPSFGTFLWLNWHVLKQPGPANVARNPEANYWRTVSWLKEVKFHYHFTLLLKFVRLASIHDLKGQHTIQAWTKKKHFLKWV